jgi:hypothetical protein
VPVYAEGTPDPEAADLPEWPEETDGGPPRTPPGTGRHVSRGAPGAPIAGRVPQWWIPLDELWLVWARAWQARRRGVDAGNGVLIGDLEKRDLLRLWLADVVARDVLDDDDRPPGERQYDWADAFLMSIPTFLRTALADEAARAYRQQLRQVRETVIQLLHTHLQNRIPPADLAALVGSIAALEGEDE